MKHHWAQLGLAVVIVGCGEPPARNDYVSAADGGRGVVRDAEGFPLDAGDLTSRDAAPVGGDASEPTDAGAEPPIDASSPAGCAQGELSCEGRCATCPTPANVVRHVCVADRCAVDVCEPGFVRCPEGCCRWRAEPVAVERYFDGVVEQGGALTVAALRDGDLTLATRTASGWTFAPTGLGAAEAASLARHPTDGLQIAINPPRTSGDLRLAREGPGGWQTEAIEVDEGIESVFGGGLLQVAADGEMHVAFLYSDSGSLRVMHSARASTGRWRRTELESYQTGTGIDLVLGPDGAPRVLTARALHTRAGASWSQVALEGYGPQPRVAVDAAGDAQICRPAFVEREGGLGVALLTPRGTGWREEVVDATNRAGEPCRIHVDAEDRTHLAYCANCISDIVDRNAFDDIRYAWREGARWRVSTVVEQGWAELSALFVDARGRAHVLYYDRTGSTGNSVRRVPMHAVLAP